MVSGTFTCPVSINYYYFWFQVFIVSLLLIKDSTLRKYVPLGDHGVSTPGMFSLFGSYLSIFLEKRLQIWSLSGQTLMG